MRNESKFITVKPNNMSDITKIKAGQVLYDKHKYKMGNTTISTWVLRTVKVIDVDPDGKWVLASWNGNPAKKYYPHLVKKWKVKEPKMPERIF